jgi:RNA polymerase sigma-70 factor (ECF subfamily)
MAQLPKAMVRESDHLPGTNGAQRQRPRPDDLLRMAHAAAAGNPDAAATLIIHVGAPMLAAVRRVMGSKHRDIDDVTQDAVIALLGALDTFRGECSVIHFAQRIAVLTALSARRRIRVERRCTDPDATEIENVPDSGLDSPWLAAVSRRRRELVQQLLDELPDVLAESLALHFAFGYTVEEIAAAASISANTVWSRLRLGKQALRRKLGRDAQLAELFELPPREPARQREGKA